VGCNDKNEFKKDIILYEELPICAYNFYLDKFLKKCDTIITKIFILCKSEGKKKGNGLFGQIGWQVPSGIEVQNGKETLFA
jgi:hypothetical protein